MTHPRPNPGPHMTAAAIQLAETRALALHPDAVAVTAITVTEVLHPDGSTSYDMFANLGLPVEFGVSICRSLARLSDAIDREATS